MTTLESAWATTPAPDPNSQSAEAPAPLGLHIARLSDGSIFQSKAGDTYLKLQFTNEQGVTWSEITGITRNGTPDEMGVKVAKAKLASVGVDASAPFNEVSARLGLKINSWYVVEVKASAKINATTGEPYRNTFVNGTASAPASAPAPVQPTAAEDIPWDQPAASNAGATTVASGAPVANSPAPSGNGSW